MGTEHKTFATAKPCSAQAFASIMLADGQSVSGVSGWRLREIAGQVGRGATARERSRIEEAFCRRFDSKGELSDGR